MEFLGFGAVVLVFVVGAVVATRLLGRSERNGGDDHGSSTSADTSGF